MLNSLPYTCFDELGLYLVSERLKPSCHIEMYAPGSYDRISSALNTPLSVDPSDPLTRVIPYLRNVKSFVERDLNQDSLQSRPQMNCKLSVGVDDSSLARLLAVSSAYEEGLALGFPLEAVKYFCSYPNSAQRDLEEVIKLRTDGADPPLWRAYLGFIPEPLTYRDPSSPSRILGESYRRDVQDNNPTLAREIERMFLLLYWENPNLV